MSYTENEMIVSRNVEEEMKDSYLRYSMSVIISRALPDVRDGLKPSQRRILYAMRELSLSPRGKHRKCAKISGDTSGDYHPHGDTVIYPTMVRMAQEWIMRYKLIDGQGNFGSIDGDPPAAMRYTEARLTNSSVQLMEDLDKDTVDMVANYDETKKEPVVFPSKFPNLLCNGSSGIAVGMATTIPPHNLKELSKAAKMLIDDPSLSIEEIMQVMPAPDFPTGGVICGYRGVKEAFHTGRGKIILRGKVRVEEPSGEKATDKERIIIDEIPYGVNKSRLIEQVAGLIHNKTITGISDLRDESDKDGLRIVIELKRGEISDVILNQLYKFSDLQTTIGANMLALDKGLPRVMNVKQMILAWVDHRIEVIRRRTRFELAKAEARAHILEGYLKAIDHLDEVVKLIRESSSREAAKEALVSLFDFSHRQANAVLDLRLYQLTGLEHEKIGSEYQALLKKIDHYRAVLASEILVREIIKEELTEIEEKHGSDRKTQIQPLEGEFGMEDLIANEPVIITISEDDYIKRMPIDTFREQRRGGQGVAGMQMKKQEDAIKGLFVATTHDHVLIFTTLGRCYWIKAWQIPETGRRSKGKPMVQLLEDIQENEKIATVLCVDKLEGERSILMATQNGVVKKTELYAFRNKRRKGIWALNVDEGDQLIAAKIIHANEQVMLFTRQGMAVRFEESQVRAMGRVARGVKGVSLKGDNDYVVGCEVVKGDESVLVVCENGFGKRSYVEEFRQTKRGGVGVKSIITSDRNGLVVGAICVSDQDGMLMMASSGQAVRISMKDLRIMGRSTQGVKLVNLKEGDHLVAMQKISEEFQEEEDLSDESSELVADTEGDTQKEAPKNSQESTLDKSSDTAQEENSSGDQV